MKRNPLNCPMYGSTRGFTLIEILVTMVILAVGLLGIAALQLKGLQFNHDAHLRSQISALAYNIADRMRLSENAQDGLASDYSGNYTVPTSRPACTQATFPVDTASASDDLSCWRQAVYDALPPGSTANISDNGSGEYTVTLGWTDRGGDTHDIAYVFIL